MACATPCAASQSPRASCHKALSAGEISGGGISCDTLSLNSSIVMVGSGRRAPAKGQRTFWRDWTARSATSKRAGFRFQTKSRRAQPSPDLVLQLPVRGRAVRPAKRWSRSALRHLFDEVQLLLVDAHTKSRPVV